MQFTALVTGSNFSIHLIRTRVYCHPDLYIHICGICLFIHGKAIEYMQMKEKQKAINLQFSLI